MIAKFMRDVYNVLMKKKVLQLAIAAAGVAFLTLGLIQGDYSDTLQKAIRICMECIGIG